MNLSKKRLMVVIAAMLAIIMAFGAAISEAEQPDPEPEDKAWVEAIVAPKKEEPEPDPEPEPDDPDEPGDVDPEDPDEPGDPDGEGEGDDVIGVLDDDEDGGEDGEGAPKMSVKLKRVREPILAIGEEYFLVATLGGFDGYGYTVAWQYDAGDDAGWADIEGCEGLEYREVDSLKLAIASDADNINYAWRIIVTPVANAGEGEAG